MADLDTSRRIRVLDIGIALGKQAAGEFLMGAASSPEFGRDEILQVGREWVAEAGAELQRLGGGGGTA